ncbi:hypothetical protein C8D88_11671 [Lentzea atacamensis]|uniref:Uncharacterized protein n=1 Tax=Lentzea atacamensis TaxID=531938 RepID=A0A316HNB1_9PSEU|nr:hypothetical protein C8D88_11671 [Lentzea atacamensis]
MTAYLTGEPATHNPCCSSHNVPMDCSIYRRTHLVEADNCCDAWATKEDKTFTPRGCPAGFSSECYYWTDSGTCRCLTPPVAGVSSKGGEGNG